MNDHEQKYISHQAFPGKTIAEVMVENPLVEVGSGTRRVCYRVGDTGYCVKFYWPKERCIAKDMKPSTYRRIKKARFNEKLNVGLKEVAAYKWYMQNAPESVREKFPSVFEAVYHPDWGFGVLMNYYANPDGTAIIPYEFEIARQTPANRKIIYDQAKSLLAELIRISAPFYEPGNFHNLILADGTIETKIVDFEPVSKMAIPLEVIWLWYRRYKLARKAKRYLKHIRETYGVVE